MDGSGMGEEVEVPVPEASIGVDACAPRNVMIHARICAPASGTDAEGSEVEAATRQYRVSIAAPATPGVPAPICANWVQPETAPPGASFAVLTISIPKSPIA